MKHNRLLITVASIPFVLASAMAIAQTPQNENRPTQAAPQPQSNGQGQSDADKAKGRKVEGTQAPSTGQSQNNNSDKNTGSQKSTQGSEPSQKTSQEKQSPASGGQQSDQGTKQPSSAQDSHSGSQSGKSTQDNSNARSPQNSQAPTANQNQQGQAPANKDNAVKQGSQTQGQTGGHAALNDQQRTKISAAIRTQNVRPVTNINFSLTVGTRVPRSVRFYTVPTAIIEVYPEYRGYNYFVANDQIVIVEPRTHEIVVMLPYSGGTASAPSSSERVQLSSEQRALIRKHATEKKVVHRREARRTKVIKYEVGEELPSDLDYYDMPEVVYTEVPSVKSYRYVVRERGGIALVEPRSRRIIEVIE